MSMSQSIESFPLQHISSDDSSSSWQMVTNSMITNQSIQVTTNGTTTNGKVRKFSIKT